MAVGGGVRARAIELRGFAAREVPLLLAADAVYVLVRALTEGSLARAQANATTLLRAERALGLDWEAGAQRVVLPHAWVVDLCNAVYVWLYWPFVFVGLALLYLLDRHRYVQVRNTIVIAGAIGLVLFATVPMSPPRFMPGYTGTVSDAAREHFVRGAPHWVNRYAALPSFHAGWTLVVSVVLASACRTRATRALALAPGVLMSAAVVATANHWITDVIVGDTITVGVFVAVARWSGPADAVREAATPAGT